MENLTIPQFNALWKRREFEFTALQSVPAQIAAMYAAAHRGDDPSVPKLEPSDFMSFDGGKKREQEPPPPDTGMTPEQLMELFQFRVAEKRLKALAKKQAENASS